jgi:hypothetical protein
MNLSEFRRLHLGELSQLTAGLSDHEHPALPPDGLHLAYYEGEYGSICIIVADRSGRFARIASPLGGNSTQPAWHPQGQVLAYRHQARPQAKWELWYTAIKGDPAPRKLLGHTEYHYKHPSFDAAGQRLAYFSDEGSPGIFHLWLADVIEPVFLRAEDEHATGEVYEWVVGFSLGERRQLTFARDRMDCHPVFSPDGRRLAYHVYRGTDENAKPAVTNLCELEIDSLAIRELTRAEDLYKHPFYLDDTVITFHHERNTDGVRRIAAMHLESQEIIGLTSGEKNDKHPFPWIDPATGQAYVLYSSKRHGEELPGEHGTYDILRAPLLSGAEEDMAKDKGSGRKDDKANKKKPMDKDARKAKKAAKKEEKK